MNLHKSEETALSGIESNHGRAFPLTPDERAVFDRLVAKGLLRTEPVKRPKRGREVIYVITEKGFAAWLGRVSMARVIGALEHRWPDNQVNAWVDAKEGRSVRHVTVRFRAGIVEGTGGTWLEAIESVEAQRHAR